MSGASSLCGYCRLIPFNVDTLEKLRPNARYRFRRRGPRSLLLPVDVGGGTELILPEKTNVFALGKTGRVLSSSCSFCSIVAMAMRELCRVNEWKGLGADTPLRVTWSRDGPGSKGVFTVNDTLDTYICFVSGQVTETPGDDLRLSSACVIHPTTFHLEASKIQSWIANCKESHGAECNADTSTAGPIKDVYRGLNLMRFVDVRKRRIVERTELVKYVALSYVWGAAATVRLTKANKRQMRKAGGLSEFGLPRTIKDAIDLTMACGEQYLWVDSLCIVQDDVEDLDAGTRVMDLVYERSEFTIAAASGHDASYGLPGVRAGSRLAPSYFEVSPGVRLGILSELESLKLGSIYDTRGWTMQEEMLSKRVVYFMSDNIYFSCPYNTISEGCSEPLRRHENGAELDPADPLRDFQKLIQNYSKRILTKDDDAFRAISGMLGRISRTHQWQIIAGMPTKVLGRMLLFEKQHHLLRRRKGFPSYSWLGWKGAVCHERFKINRGWIIWYVWRPAKDTLSIDYRAIGREANVDATESLETTDDGFTCAPRFKLLPGIDWDRKAPSFKDGMPPPRPFPLLCFWTLAVFLNLEFVNYVKGTAWIKAPVDSKHRSKFRDPHAGVVTLDVLDDYPLSGVGEFILLNETSSGYTALLIDWIDGVAERRGIGYIELDLIAIQDSLSPGPIWKEIVLG